MQDEMKRLKKFILPSDIYSWFLLLPIPIKIYEQVKYNNKIKELELNGELEKVLEDFKTAEPYFGGKLLLGNTYIFGKGSGTIHSYSEIKSIYQHIQRTNFIETERELRLTLTSGKSFGACNIPLRGKGDAELNAAVTAICQRNPNITL